MGKTGRKNKSYSAEFKISVIMDMREHHLGYCETARKYDLGDPRKGTSIHTLQRWERIFLEEGTEGLMKERRGRACSTGGTRKGKQRKNDKYHSYKGTVGKVTNNILKRDFYAEKPFKKITTDVTQFNVCDEKVYLSPVLDLFNNEVAAYSVSTSPNLE